LPQVSAAQELQVKAQMRLALLIHPNCRKERRM
jgi:hypothetical protein